MQELEFLNDVIEFLDEIQYSRDLELSYKVLSGSLLGLACGGLVWGRRAALAGTVLGAIISFDRLPGYRKLLNKLRKLDEKEMQLVQKKVKFLSKSDTIEKFREWFSKDGSEVLFHAALTQFLDQDLRL